MKTLIYYGAAAKEDLRFDSGRENVVDFAARRVAASKRFPDVEDIVERLSTDFRSISAALRLSD